LIVSVYAENYLKKIMGMACRERGGHCDRGQTGKITRFIRWVKKRMKQKPWFDYSFPVAGKLAIKGFQPKNAAIEPSIVIQTLRL